MQTKNTADESNSPTAQLTQYQNPELESLRAELAILENELAELLIEKGEVQAVLHANNVALHEELGELISQVLEARVRVAEAEKAATKEQATERKQQANEKAHQAQREYEQFKEQQEEMADAEPIVELPDEQKKELESLYKKSVQKSHPDRLSESQRAAATEMMQELNNARQQQDLTCMRELFEQIQNGEWDSAADSITDTQILQQRIAMIRDRIAAVKTELQNIYADSTWETLQELTEREISWQDYFAEARAALEKELAKLNQTATQNST